MGAVTWKNIAPVSSAGILDSINEAGQQIGTGFGGIGDAFTQYADDRTTRETDSAINDLLQFEDLPLEADAYLKGIDNSFLDMGRIRDARKNLTADADELALYSEKAAVDHENKIKELNLEATAARIKALATKNKPLKRGDLSAALIKRDTVGGDNPFNAFLAFDSPVQDMDAVIQAYLKNREITDSNERDLIRRFIFDDSNFDTDLLNAYYFGDDENSSPDDDPFDYFDLLIKSKKKQYILDNAALNK
jgi:hypothetical protein